MKYKYPSVDKIIEYNFLSITLIRAKKADQPSVLSPAKLHDILNGCEQLQGDAYDKAAFLLKNIIQRHPFASGNRRTALIAAKAFLTENGYKFNVPDDPEQANVMTGIREGYYSDSEIKEWLKNGKIREFKR